LPYFDFHFFFACFLQQSIDTTYIVSKILALSFGSSFVLTKLSDKLRVVEEENFPLRNKMEKKGRKLFAVDQRQLIVEDKASEYDWLHCSFEEGDKRIEFLEAQVSKYEILHDNLLTC
jgi:hypothetical protein